MVMPVDTVVGMINMDTRKPVDTTKVKGVFIYRVYLFVLKNGTKAHYITEEGQGLIEYAIGSKKITVTYEDIPVEPASVYLRLKQGIKEMLADW